MAKFKLDKFKGSTTNDSSNSNISQVNENQTLKIENKQNNLIEKSVKLSQGIKPGRKPLEDQSKRRNRKVTTLFTEKEYTNVEKKAEEEGLTISNFIRYSVMQQIKSV